MSKVERREFQETKVMRTVSPNRYRSSTQNLAEFDNNLDNLLEDLQASVSRPGSALGHSTNYRETSRSANTLDNPKSSSLSRISNVKSQNPVTEYSSDDAYNYTTPDGRKHVSGYKKESYSYKTSGSAPPPPTEKVRVQNSINQLDSLLDDLQQVKQTSLLDEHENSLGIEPAFRSSSRSRTLEKAVKGSTITKDVQYSNEGSYGDIRNNIRPISPSPSSRSSTLSKQTKVTNVHSYPVEVQETAVPDINPEILAHLDPHLRPPGNTKVTTTIKTYTYEIPGSGDFPTNLDSTVESDKYIYSPNDTQTTPSKSFVYNKTEKNLDTVEYTTSPPAPPPTQYINKQYYNKSSSDVTNTYQHVPYQKPAPPGSQVVKEVVTTRNYQPGYTPERDPPGSHQTYIYNETTTTKNVDSNGFPYPPPEPPRQDTYYIKEVHNKINTNVNRPYPDDYPRRNPPHETRIIKETHNTTSNINYPYPNGYPPKDVSTVIYKEEKHTTNNYLPGNRPHTPNDTETFDPKHPPFPKSGPRRPEEPVNINYKYSSKSATTNNYRVGYQPQSENEPLLPQKFPTDDADGPPKKLDDLMATIGREPPNSPLNAGFTAHEQELIHQKKVEALKQQSAEKEEVEILQKKEQVARTKNVSGPPVYYPPGHEMFAKKEEAAGWRAEGAYARESGKYMQESDGGSKTKVRSGAAVVPVCLPLCCGLPCVIL